MALLLRFLHVLLLALFLTQASGVVQALELDTCSASCPDDEAEEGACPDDCPTCACCVHVQGVVSLSPPVLTLPLEHPPVRRTHATAPEAAEPRGIKHVPKRAS